jgi:hypothetical protein
VSSNFEHQQSALPGGKHMKQVRVQHTPAGVFLVDVSCECGRNGLKNSQTLVPSFKHQVRYGGETVELVCECGSRYELRPQDDHFHIVSLGNRRLIELENGLVADLQLEKRIYNVLDRANIKTVKELQERAEELIYVRGVAQKTKWEIRCHLLELGFKLGPEWKISKSWDEGWSPDTN